MYTWWPETSWQSSAAPTSTMMATSTGGRRTRSLLGEISSVEFERLRQSVRGQILLDEPMRNHTSFRIGGPADLLVYVQDEEDLQHAAGWFRDQGLPFKVVGNGSNILVSDEGIRGGVIKLTPRFNQVTFEGETMLVGAGAKLARVVQQAAEAGLSGLESTVGIPGTLGGALVTNAGTDTGSIGDLVSEAMLMDERGEIRVWKAEELGYSYRQSKLPASRMIVLRARLALEARSQEEIVTKMERLGEKRAGRQPLRFWSAGCVFKNPLELAAGKLLDRAGAKGMTMGGAEVSRKHANFIINRGSATASEVRAMIERLHQMALLTYGLDLELEIELVGE